MRDQGRGDRSSNKGKWADDCGNEKYGIWILQCVVAANLEFSGKIMLGMYLEGGFDPLYAYSWTCYTQFVLQDRRHPPITFHILA